MVRVTPPKTPPTWEQTNADLERLNAQTVRLIALVIALAVLVLIALVSGRVGGAL